MQKISIILFIILYISGCSVSRFDIQKDTDNKSIDVSTISLSDVKKQNLSSFSFFIRKAEIELIKQGEKQRFIASLKFNHPDSFLISLRSSTGIEAARILLTRDTILINDRINKAFYFGTETAAKKKYGFSSLIFPVLLGDVITSNRTESTVYKCDNGFFKIESLIDESKVNYLFDCKRMKSISMTLTKEIDTKPVQIIYDDYTKGGNIHFFRKVSIKDLYNFETISIKYIKVEVPWEGIIQFIPGNNYEQIEIK